MTSQTPPTFIRLKNLALLYAISTTAACALLLWQRNNWLVSPTATASMGLLPLLFLSPIFASIQCHISRGQASLNLRNWMRFTPRKKLQANLSTISPVLLVAFLCALSLVVFANIISYKEMSSPDAIPIWGPIAGYLALMLLSISCGHVITALALPRTVSPVLAFILSFAAGLFCTQYGTTEPYQDIDKRTLLALVTATIAMFLLAINTYPVISNPQKFLVAATIAVVLATPMGVATIRPQIVLRTPADPICTASSPQICVWHEHKWALQPLSQFTQALSHYLPTGMHLSSRIEELGLDGTANASKSIPITANMRTNQAQLRTSYLLTVTNRYYTGLDMTPQASEARSNLELWLFTAALTGANYNNIKRHTELEEVFESHPNSETTPELYDEPTIERVKNVLKQPKHVQKQWANQQFKLSTQKH
ncbi:hypothetical protein [Gleimia hominis]|uniref:hypothetical protein n=1 Tax=Gleimia hominis TaxID=595468 RepID=UPI0011AEE33A|nr:hypothetical protein [Gleimia hominis]WIK64122.1 hypothetical protein CJ187_007400 [Gleimia hominis]